MEIPAKAYSADLTDYQFRLLATMCHLSGAQGGFKASVADLCSRTGNPSDRTVRRAIKALEEHGFLVVEKTRRANGYQGVNRYKLQTDTSDTLEKIQTDTSDRTSLVYKSHALIVDKSLVPSSSNTNSNQYFETEGFMKEVLIPMRKYEDDGEDLAGFGLVEDRTAEQPKIRKSDPKTRKRRPEHEWTPMDVAAEFSFRVGRKYPLLPGTVNVRQLSGALAKFRKQYDTNALIELELLRLFMMDERNFRDIGDEAPHLYKMFLASFGKKMNQARENLGLNKITAPSETVVKMGTLTASDGTVFQNSLSGRAQLERHEKRLQNK